VGRRSSPLDALRIHRGGRGGAVALALCLLGVAPIRLLVVDAVVVGRRRRARHRRGRGLRLRRRRRRLEVVGEHGQELIVVEAVEVMRPGIAVAGAGLGLGLEEGHGVADGAAVRAALGGGEVEELVHPRRLHGRGGEERAHGGAALLLVPAPELRPRRRHGGDLGRQLRHGRDRDPAPRVGSTRGINATRGNGGATPETFPPGPAP
jgi:hypothetical protein